MPTTNRLLLTAARVLTFIGDAPLTNASGFFYEAGDRLFLATSRHVLLDEDSSHAPDRIEIEFHTDRENLTQTTTYSIPIYRYGRSLWRDAADSGGAIDIAVIEIERDAMPPTAALHAFSISDQVQDPDEVEIGATVLIVGFPLGFQDTLHHMPVARQAIVASAFGLRFQGHGFFLTDARTHRGLSGAPVVMRTQAANAGNIGWRLLGVHSSRLDIAARDHAADEVLGLNCAWYADVLETLTKS